LYRPLALWTEELSRAPMTPAVSPELVAVAA
jgi:hypothetical protein